MRKILTYSIMLFHGVYDIPQKGLDKGRRDPFGPKEEMGERISVLQGEIYPRFAELVGDIKEEYGTLICAEMSQPFGDFDSKPRKKNCMQVIATCAGLAVKHTEK